ncbi:MAG TPA: transporter substrate-binding domain-containing protein [Methanomassiliicoccaceae archaeon]|nr:transporter substrate-binding domain-containing protein [Methanomassiliicoccaceae archaeon]
MAAVAIVAIVAVAAIGFVLLGNGADNRTALEKIKDRGTLIIGTSAGFPPFEMMKDGGGVEGVDIDIAQKIADALNVRLVVDNYDDFSMLISALQQEKVDMIVAGMTITDARNESVTFSMPYYKADQALVVLKTNDAIQSTEDLAGKKVAVNTGTTGQYYVEDELPGVDLNTYGTASDTFQALIGNKVDAVIIDEPVANNYITDDGPYQIVQVIETNEFYGIAMPKTNADDPIQEVNRILGEMIENGDLEDIISKWSKAA